MPFSREHLLRDCKHADDALEFARLGLRKGLETRLDQLRFSHLHRHHHDSRESERALFEAREPGLVAAVDGFDSALDAVAAKMATDAILADPRDEGSPLTGLALAVATLRAAMEGESAVTGSQAKLLRYLRYRGGHYRGKLRALADSGDIRLEEIPPSGGRKWPTWRMVVLSERAYNPNG